MIVVACTGCLYESRSKAVIIVSRTAAAGQVGPSTVFQLVLWNVRGFQFGLGVVVVAV